MWSVRVQSLATTLTSSSKRNQRVPKLTPRPELSEGQLTCNGCHSLVGTHNRCIREGQFLTHYSLSLKNKNHWRRTFVILTTVPYNPFRTFGCRCLMNVQVFRQTQIVSLLVWYQKNIHSVTRRDRCFREDFRDVSILDSSQTLTSDETVWSPSKLSC